MKKSKNKTKEVNTKYGDGVIISEIKFNGKPYVKLKMVSGLNLTIPKSRVNVKI